MDNFFKQKLKEEYKNHNLARPFIVAIDGLSGAGKMTLVHQLKNEIDNVVVIHTVIFLHYSTAKITVIKYAY